MSEVVAADDVVDVVARGAARGCRIAVLLAVLDGAEFLPELLQSLAAQTAEGWRLLWRDDGSRDQGPALLEAFGRQNAGAAERVSGPEGRVGVAASFHALACAAPAEAAIAFCDQDDVWLPHKLARAYEALGALPAGVPGLYCARQILADAALQPIGVSMQIRRAPDFAMALTQNVATGCTVMLNAAAAALFRAAPPPAGSFHDWWCLLLVSGAGGRVVVDPEPSLFYRQHGGNQVGAPRSRWRRAVAAVRRGPGAFMAVFRAQVEALAACGAVLTVRHAALVVAVRAALGGGVAARAAVLWRGGLRRQTRLETALFMLWFLIG